MNFFNFLIFLILTFSIIFYIFFKPEEELKWDWKKIIINEDLVNSFPKNFIFGAASAAHQIEGNSNNNQWYLFENEGKSLNKSGKACNSWELYKEDVKLLKEFKLQSYRFSIEWSKIEPKENEFNNEAINYYSNLIDELLKNNIEPMITLHHFTERKKKNNFFF
jgi:hypothetical protein